MFCERFSSLDWKTTENNVIIFKKTTSLITQFLYQVDWFLEQEDNSKLERTTIEEQLSSESWSFVTKINQFKSLVRVLRSLEQCTHELLGKLTAASGQCGGPGVNEYFVVHALYDR